MKFYAVPVFFILVSLCLLPACNTTTKKVLAIEEIQKMPKVLEYSRSGCRGKCPIFDFTVYKDGWAVFNGKAFTKYEGKKTFQLTKEEFTQLQTNCKKADLWRFQPEYGMNIMDIPTTTIHYYEKNRDKVVAWRMRAPEALPNLSTQIMELIFDRDWVERQSINKDTGIKMPAGAIDNELIVQFKSKIDPRKWCAQFERYDMQLKKTLSTLTPIYLVSFDTGKMSPDQMLEIVKGNESVASAEFNKRLKGKKR